MYKIDSFKELGDPANFVQDNLSYSKKGVLRGLHLQLPPFQQAKLVTVITGSVLDMVVDLRKNSDTFGQSYKCLLDSRIHNMLIIPEGFAHGFSALEDVTFFYKCSSFYNPQCETGICWNDPDLNIDWEITHPILSDKDAALTSLKELLRKSVISRN